MPSVPASLKRSLKKPLESSLALDAAVIEAGLPVEVAQAIDSIEVFDSIASTQSYLKDQSLKNQGSSNRLCVAESQLAGKGRRGREWVAAGKGDVLLSLSWAYESAPIDLSALSLAVVAEIAECLVVRYALPIKIKWPNDLLLLNEKLAGFIVDVETGKHCQVTIGIGLNVAARNAKSVKAINQPATTLSNAGVHDVDRNDLIAEMVGRLAKLLIVYPDVGFSAYKSKWESFAAYIGEQVILQRRDNSDNNLADIVVAGVLESVDEQGCLCVRDVSGEMHKILDSELSLRLL